MTIRINQLQDIRETAHDQYDDVNVVHDASTINVIHYYYYYDLVNVTLSKELI